MAQLQHRLVCPKAPPVRPSVASPCRCLLVRSGIHLGASCNCDTAGYYSRSCFECDSWFFGLGGCDWNCREWNAASSCGCDEYTSYPPYHATCDSSCNTGCSACPSGKYSAASTSLVAPHAVAEPPDQPMPEHRACRCTRTTGFHATTRAPSHTSRRCMRARAGTGTHVCNSDGTITSATCASMSAALVHVTHLVSLINSLSSKKQSAASVPGGR